MPTASSATAHATAARFQADICVALCVAICADTWPRPASAGRTMLCASSAARACTTSRGASGRPRPWACSSAASKRVAAASPQATARPSAAAEATAGAPMGKVSVHQARHRDAPSERATASSIGSVASKAGRSSRTIQGRVIARTASTTPTGKKLRRQPKFS